MKLFIFVDGLFVNNKDLSSQFGYVIILANKDLLDSTFEISGNIIHYLSTKSKRVIKSILVFEIYGMVVGIDIGLYI